LTARRARHLLLLLTALFAVAVTWPGLIPANRVRRPVLGLPFTFVWVALWIVLGFIVLVFVDRSLHGHGSGTDNGGRP
jgi:TRAP-type C4-dicarboxylate transport system permease small subunit